MTFQPGSDGSAKTDTMMMMLPHPDYNQHQIMTQGQNFDPEHEEYTDEDEP